MVETPRISDPALRALSDAPSDDIRNAAIGMAVARAGLPVGPEMGEILIQISGAVAGGVLNKKHPLTTGRTLEAAGVQSIINDSVSIIQAAQRVVKGRFPTSWAQDISKTRSKYFLYLMRTRNSPVATAVSSALRTSEPSRTLRDMRVHNDLIKQLSKKDFQDIEEGVADYVRAPKAITTDNAAILAVIEDWRDNRLARGTEFVDPIPPQEIDRKRAKNIRGGLEYLDGLDAEHRGALTEDEKTLIAQYKGANLEQKIEMRRTNRGIPAMLRAAEGRTGGGTEEPAEPEQFVVNPIYRTGYPDAGIPGLTEQEIEYIQNESAKKMSPKLLSPRANAIRSKVRAIKTETKRRKGPQRNTPSQSQITQPPETPQISRSTRSQFEAPTGESQEYLDALAAFRDMEPDALLALTEQQIADICQIDEELRAYETAVREVSQ